MRETSTGVVAGLYYGRTTKRERRIKTLRSNATIVISPKTRAIFIPSLILYRPSLPPPPPQPSALPSPYPSQNLHFKERKLLEREREEARHSTRGARVPMATRRSALSHFFLLLLASIALLAATSEAVSASGAGTITGGAEELGWIAGRTACRGTIAECIAGDEFELDSEISRRILASSSHISYEALKRGSVPCSRRGVSYYNCRPGANANPYSRGCSRITQCRS